MPTAMVAKRGLLNKPLHLSNVQNALVTTAAVLVALAMSQVSVLATYTGFMVMTTQIVTGANLAADARERLVHVGRIVLVLLATALVVALVRGNLYLSMAALVLLAFSFGYWRQYYPANFKDINTPSGVVFFLTLATPGFWPPLIGVAIGGGLALLAHGLMVLLMKPHAFDPDDFPTVDETVYPTAHNLTRLHPDLIRYCVQLAVLLVLGMLVFEKTGSKHGYWMPFATMIVLQMDRKATGKRLAERLLGTIVGCLVGTGILELHPPQWILLGLLVASIYLFLYFIRQHYAVGAGFVTVYVLLLIASHAGNPVEVALERVAFTLAGGAAAYLSYFLFWKRKPAPAVTV